MELARSLDLSHCQVALLPGGDGRFFKVYVRGFKVGLPYNLLFRKIYLKYDHPLCNQTAFMCPSAQDCAAWVAAITISQSKDRTRHRLCYTDLEDAVAERSISSTESLSHDEVKRLRRQLAGFYRDIAPHKLQKIDGIVADFVSRGSTRSELQYLNDELRTVYGVDLTSISLPEEQISRIPYTDLEEKEGESPKLQSSTAKNRTWEAVSTALAVPESQQVAQGDILYSSKGMASKKGDLVDQTLSATPADTRINWAQIPKPPLEVRNGDKSPLLFESEGHVATRRGWCA